MVSINSLIFELNEKTIAQLISIPCDESLMRFTLRKNTVTSYDEFSETIGSYFNYLHSNCISPGGRLSGSQASSWAKEILDREYRRQGGDIVSAYNDARDGTKPRPDAGPSDGPRSGTKGRCPDRVPGPSARCDAARPGGGGRHVHPPRRGRAGCRRPAAHIRCG